MMRLKNTLVLAGMALAVALPASSAARTSRPLIKGEEVGYFGGATVTHRLSVFVYSNLGPRTGNHVTVCLRGACRRARGHNGRLDWYAASFSTRGLRMSQSVRFTVIASRGVTNTRVTVTKPLLCMHNNGSTPQA